MTISNRQETSQSIQAGNFCTLRLVKMKEPELPGGGGGPGVEEPEPQWKRYSDSRRRANAAYEERKKCVDSGRTRRSKDLRGSRKRVVLSEETFQRWNIVKLKEFVESTNDEFASSLLDRYEEHSENCSTFSVGNTEDSDSDAPSLPSSVGSIDATHMSDSAKKRKRKARDLRHQAKHNPKNICVFNNDLEEIRTIGKEKHLTDKKVISLLLATFLHTKKSMCVDQSTQTMPDVYSCSHCGSSPPTKLMPPLARPQPSGPQQIRLMDRVSNPLPKTPNIKVIVVKKSTAGVLKQDSRMTPQALNNLMLIGSNLQAAQPLHGNLTGSSQPPARCVVQVPGQGLLTGKDIPGSPQVVNMEPVKSMEDFEQLPKQEFSQAKCIDEKDNTEDYIYDDGSMTLDDRERIVVVKEEVLSDLEQSNSVHSDNEESFFDPRQDQEFGSDSKLVYSEPGWYGQEQEDMVEEEDEDEMEDDLEDDEEIDYEAQELLDPTHDPSASMPQHSIMNSKDIPGSSKTESSKCLGGQDSLESADSLEYGGDSDEDFDFQFPEACPICSEAWDEKPEIMHHLQKHIPIDKGPEAIKDAVQSIKSKFEKGHKFDMGWCWECKELLLGFRAHFNKCHNNNPKCIVMCKCQQCGRMIRSSYIKTHEISHLDIKESDYVQCPQCPSRFKHRIFLKGHIKKNHKALRDLQCSTCGKIFKSWQQLQRHSLIHSGLKPYSCSMCDRSFIQKNSLKIHMRQHTGDKPYVCEVCEKAFTHKISLKNHKKKQHGIDWWKEQRKIKREIKVMALNRENK